MGSVRQVGKLFAALFTMMAVVSAPVYASVNDFTISKFDSHMTLGRDTEHRSTLKTTETITAEFPQIDQNHGLERAIPKEYDGHTTNLQIQSVTDENGTTRTYSTYDDGNGNLIVRMADMNVYVHGTQTYVLTYTQRDVTKFYSDTNADEFYWDINGTDWRAPITALTYTLTLDDSLVAAQTGKNACYKGAAGSTEICTLQQDGAVITASASNLSVGENVTVAVGFQPETFVGYQKTLFETVAYYMMIAQIVGAVIFAVGVIWVIIAYYKWRYRSRELNPIAPEYIPPRDASVSIAAEVIPTQTAVGTAQLMDLAVRRYIRIIETNGMFGSKEYAIEVMQDVQSLRPEETELLTDIFHGTTPAVGETLDLKSLRRDFSLGSRLTDNQSKMSKLASGQYHLFEKDEARKKMYRRWALVWCIAGVLLLTVPFLMLALTLFVLSFLASRLGDEGLALRRYMAGLKMYIKVAETERLKMSQSPEAVSALATFDADGKKGEQKILRLYERLLPYAILFGEEKKWSAELGKYYEKVGMQPDWYSGQSMFNAAVFSTAMSGISRSMNAYAGGTSSSTGGSGGGGFSGGGGGGGGGGGV